MAKPIQSSINFTLFLIFFYWAGNLFSNNSNAFVGFEENKGQVVDEEGNSVDEVLFRTSSNGVDVYITDKGISYFFFKPVDSLSNDSNHLCTYQWNLIEAVLQGANIKKENIVFQNPFGETKYNYYKSNVEVHGLKHYQKVVVKEVYPGIDWVLYSQNERGMKYEFIVHPGANPDQIVIKYEGDLPLTLNENGSYSANCQLGYVSEGVPETFTEYNRKKVNSRFAFSGQTVRFNLGRYDRSQPLVIDPPVVWSTFFGGQGDDTFAAFKHDSKGNLFVLGHTGSALAFPLQALTGAYYLGTVTGTETATITKFDKNGVKLWCTFFGAGTAYDFAISPKEENVFIVGSHNRYSPAFPGTNPNQGSYYQSTNLSTIVNAYHDAFVVKFDSSGAKQWATLYGGDGNEQAYGVECDAKGDVYIGGYTSSTNFPLQNKTGAYNSTAPGTGAMNNPKLFFIKYTSAGVRKWATYCGGSGNNMMTAMAASYDRQHIYATGYAIWSPGFPTVPPPGTGGYYKAANASLQNMFLIELDTTCAMPWSTYYGGNASNWDQGTGLGSDQFGNIYLLGQVTNNDVPIVSPHATSFTQPTIIPGAFFGGASKDGAIVQFDKNRKLIWSTYLGGNDEDQLKDAIVDNAGNLYVCGGTISSNMKIENNPGFYNKGIFTGTAYTPDAYIAQFDVNRKMTWSSYFGGNNYDYALDLEHDSLTDCVYMGGHSNSTTGLYTQTLQGAYNQATLKSASATDEFIVKMCAAFTVKDTATPPQCFSGGDGTATAMPEGGIAPFTYSWSNGQTDSIATGLIPGTYTVVVTDQTNQSVTNIITVTEPAALTATTDSTTSVCSMSTGSASASASGGTPGYSYSWSNGQTDSVATALAAGNYDVVITDANGCTISKTVTVNNMNGPAVIANTTSHVQCYGDNDGQALASANGGTGPYTYSWNTSPVQTDSVASSLPAGVYTVQITDANNCTITDTVLVNGPTEITGSLASVPTTCYGDADGSATISSVNGGAGGYSYSWTNGSTNNSISNVSNSTYMVVVTDANTCTQVFNIMVTQPSAVGVSLSSTPELEGTSNGIATAIGGGGTIPLTYQWNTTPAQTTQTATGLAAGIYEVIVTDNNGCFMIDSIEVELKIPCAEPYLPTAFSPNNDNVNDKFCVRVEKDCIVTFELIIYNRWGERVFYSTDVTQCWDGTYHSVWVDPGIFVYYINYTTTEEAAQVSKKGNVTLVR